MTSAFDQSGFYPPLQARSRAVLQRVLNAAEQVLEADGVDAFTMAAVAEQAGTSIGAIYRRFAGKEQLLAAVKDRLLSKLEADLAEELRNAHASLDGVIRAFCVSIADALGRSAGVFPDLLRTRGAELDERGRLALAVTRELLLTSTRPYVEEIRRADPEDALAVVWQTIVGACIHRAHEHGRTDIAEWHHFAEELAEMAMAYLTSPSTPKRTDRSRRRTK